MPESTQGGKELRLSSIAKLAGAACAGMAATGWRRYRGDQAETLADQVLLGMQLGEYIELASALDGQLAKVKIVSDDSHPTLAGSINRVADLVDQLHHSNPMGGFYMKTRACQLGLSPSDERPDLRVV